jgi:hypothetical protein
MKKTIELLKDAKAAKKAGAFSLSLSLFFVIIIIICLKLGIDRWNTYDDPMTWSELYFKLPWLFLFGIGLFVVFFFTALFDKGGSRSFFICTKCLSIYHHNRVKNGICPNCFAKVEILAGFYERHPEFRNKKRRK